MQNSWLLTTLHHDRQELQYIFVCACSHIAYKKEKELPYTCEKCKNKKFIKVDEIDKAYKEFKFDMKKQKTDDMLKIKFYFDKPYIDAKNNKVKIVSHTILEVEFDYLREKISIKKSDKKTLNYHFYHDNTLKSLEDIVFEKLLPIMTKEYFIPKFKKYHITYHIPDDASLSTKIELLNIYNKKCKKES